MSDRDTPASRGRERLGEDVELDLPAYDAGCRGKRCADPYRGHAEQLREVVSGRACRWLGGQELAAELAQIGGRGLERLFQHALVERSTIRSYRSIFERRSPGDGFVENRADRVPIRGPPR